jgi:hypothetical protein
MFASLSLSLKATPPTDRSPTAPLPSTPCQHTHRERERERERRNLLSPIFTLSFSSLKLPQWLTLCMALLGPSIRRYALESSDHLFLLKAQTISKAQTMHSSRSFLQYNTTSLIRDSTTHRLERLNDAVESSRQALALFSNSMVVCTCRSVDGNGPYRTRVFLACTLWA